MLCEGTMCCETVIQNMLSFNEKPGQLSILSSENGSPLVVQNAASTARPYLHPMLAPDGVGVATQDAPLTHPWQHGLYFGLNKVNGVGFWTEGLREKSRMMDGKVVSTRLVPVSIGASARWTVDASWHGLAGEPLLVDSTDWTLSIGHDCYWLDAAWRLTAVVDTEFGQSAYGGMFLRMPVHDGADPRLLSSEGATSPDAAEGQRAKWLAVAIRLAERSSLPADRQHVCMTLMDHPSNPEHPVPWRADTKFGIGPSRCVAGAWRLSAGQSATFRHRILVSIGVPTREMIEPSYQAFSGNTP